jgi:hypothetical protein
MIPCDTVPQRLFTETDLEYSALYSANTSLITIKFVAIFAHFSDIWLRFRVALRCFLGAPLKRGDLQESAVLSDIQEAGSWKPQGPAKGQIQSPQVKAMSLGLTTPTTKALGFLCDHFAPSCNHQRFIIGDSQDVPYS